MVAFYYNSYSSGGPKTPEGTSESVNAYGWASSWRGEDADEILWNASDPAGGGTYFFPGVPMVFIIDTSSMVIAETTNALADVQALND